MEEITTQFYTYQEFKNRVPIKNDPHSLTFTKEAINRTLLTNPNLSGLDEVCVIIKRVDGIVGGRTMTFLGKIRVNGIVCPELTGTSMDVAEEFRHLALGADIMMDNMNLGFDYLIAGGASKMAFPLFKRLKYHVLEYPRMWQIRNLKYVFSKLKIKGWLLSFITVVGNALYRPWLFLINYMAKWSVSHFSIQQLSDIPDWVEDITVNNDKHKYMEIHDNAWFHWVLNNNFDDIPQNKQSFYCVKRNEEIVGFFMTKERLLKFDNGLPDIVYGGLVEWGTKDDNVLSEYDICKLALNTFSKGIDFVAIATANTKTCNSLKKYGFIKNGNANIMFKDKTKKCKDASDINLWRVRPCYGDLAFF